MKPFYQVIDATLRESSTWMKEFVYQESEFFKLTEEEFARGEKRLEMKTVGPWSIPISLKGLTIYRTEEQVTGDQKLYVFGQRTMQRPTNCGYDMEGRCSIKGIKGRVFTSSILIADGKGRLINIGVLYVSTDFMKKLGILQ